MSAVDAAKQLLLQSGAAWILWLLGALSVVSLLIIVERGLYFRSRGSDLEATSRQLDEPLSLGEWEVAIRRLEAQPATANAIASAGLRLADRGPAAVEKAMQSAVALERRKLERGLAFLGTVGNNAPFVGLFGTVVGVIHAFEELGHAAPGHAGGGMAGQVASQAVMVGIAEALVATALGILVALPAVAAYNYFQRRLAGVISGSEVLSNLVLAYLSVPAAPAGDREVRGGG